MERSFVLGSTLRALIDASGPDGCAGTRVHILTTWAVITDRMVGLDYCWWLAYIHVRVYVVASGILDSARVIVVVSLMIFSHTVVRGLDLVPGLIQSSYS
jgi:hypothetical protein